jgi:hypothetical protein
MGEENIALVQKAIAVYSGTGEVAQERGLFGDRDEALEAAGPPE